MNEKIENIQKINKKKKKNNKINLVQCLKNFYQIKIKEYIIILKI